MSDDVPLNEHPVNRRPERRHPQAYLNRVRATIPSHWLAYDDPVGLSTGRYVLRIAGCGPIFLAACPQRQRIKCTVLIDLRLDSERTRRATADRINASDRLIKADPTGPSALLRLEAASLCAYQDRVRLHVRILIREVRQLLRDYGWTPTTP